MESSENTYGNVNDGDPCQRSLDEDENVYANQETTRTQISTQTKKESGEISGAGTIETKGCKVAVVILGLLCVLLLIVIIVIVTKHTAETQQLQRHMDLLQSNVTRERDLFQERNTKLTEENHELNRNVTVEKNDLMKKNRNLIAEKEKLLNTFLIPQGWRRFGDSFYYISNNETTWSDGKQQCMDRGGYLVIIDGEEEQVFISGFQKRGWIGLTDVEGPWKWLDGELLKTGYWMKGEPNALKENEHCAEIIGHAGTALKNWNDFTCTARRNYFCERPL